MSDTRPVFGERDIVLELRGEVDRLSRQLAEARGNDLVERMTCVLGEIARGRSDNGRPLAAETSRQLARDCLSRLGLGWPVR